MTPCQKSWGGNPERDDGVDSGGMDTRLIALALAGAITLLSGCSSSDRHPSEAKASTTASTITHTRVPHSTTPAEGIVGVAPRCTPATGPPQDSRLAYPKDYPAIQLYLTVVEPTIQPKVSGAEAFTRLSYQPGAEDCGLTEFLAYWSSGAPANIPADCVPQATASSPWVAPANCASTPLYKHVLAWVFTWRTDCLTLGGPVESRAPTVDPASSSPPQPCTAITFVDADTGDPSAYLTTGEF